MGTNHKKKFGMNTETCIKYLDFVNKECDRFLDDNRVTDDELNQLIIEFQRFQQQVADSELPEPVKNRIGGMTIDYSRAQIERGYWYMFAVLLTLGLMVIFLSYWRQLKRKRALVNLKSEASSALMFIKMNY